MRTFAGLLLCLGMALGCGGCFVQVRELERPEGMHEVASGGPGNAVRMEVARLEGWHNSKGAVVVSGDGSTAAGVNSEFRWYMDLHDLSEEAGGRHETRPGEYIHDYNVHVYDLRTGKEQRTLSGHTRYVTALAISQDARVVVSIGGDGGRAWDVESGRALCQLESAGVNVMATYVSAIAISGDGSRAYLENYGKQKGILEWDLQTNQTRMRAEQRLTDIAGAWIGNLGRRTEATSPDGAWRVAGAPMAAMRSAYLWELRDARTEAVAMRLQFDTSAWQPMWRADGGGFDLLASDWRVIRIRLPAKMEQRERALVPSRVVALDASTYDQELAVSPDGQHAIVGAALWRAETPDRLQSWQRRKEPQWSADGRRFGTADIQNLRQYSIEKPSQLESTWTPGPGSQDYWRGIESFFLGVDRTRALTREQVGTGTRAIMWDVGTGKELWEKSLEKGGYCRISGDGARVVLWKGRDFIVWDAQTGVPLKQFSLPPDIEPGSDPYQFSLSNDGRIAVMAGVELWTQGHSRWQDGVFIDLEGGALAGKFAMDGLTRNVALSHDGAMALAVEQAGGVEVLQTHGGHLVARLARPGAIDHAVFAADGSMFTASRKELCIWAPVTADDSAHTVPLVRLTGAATGHP